MILIGPLVFGIAEKSIIKPKVDKSITYEAPLFRNSSLSLYFHYRSIFEISKYRLLSQLKRIEFAVSFLSETDLISDKTSRNEQVLRLITFFPEKMTFIIWSIVLQGQNHSSLDRLENERWNVDLWILHLRSRWKSMNDLRISALV